jgi:predicted Fe-Mo cluster-binding NifX family protein
MTIAFSTTGSTLDAPLDPRFGRAPRFLVYDTESGAVDLLDNQQGVDAVQGAGIGAAQAVARAGAEAVVTGHCGPKAFRALGAAGVRVYASDAPTVAAALEAWRAGALVACAAPDRAGHGR